MVRILHVMDQGADFQTRRSVEQLAGSLGEGFALTVRTLGRGGDWRGVIAAAAALRRIKDIDVVHTWGGQSLLAAALGWRGRIVHCPIGPVTARTVRWLRAIQGYRQVTVIVPTATAHGILLSHGVSPESCQVVRPGVDLSRMRRGRNQELRAALGLADDDVVLAAPGESTREAAHTDALWTTVLLHGFDPRHRLLLWGRGAALPAVRHFLKGQGIPRSLCLAEPVLKRSIEPEELLTAADLVLVPAIGQAAPLPICIAMAGGLPIISTATSTTSELLEDHHNCLMVPPHSPRLTAQRVIEIREDPTLQWRLADTARSDAYKYFAMNQFVEAWKALYGKDSVGFANEP